MIKGAEDFKVSSEYADLNNHRAELLTFYASPAFKAQQAFLEAMRATYSQTALTTGRTAEAREEARVYFNATGTLLDLPRFIGELLDDQAQEAAPPAVE